MTLALGEDLLIKEVFIESNLVLIHVYHAHAANFKAARYQSLLQKEAKGILRLSALSEDTSGLVILRSICHLPESNILKYDADVLRVELIILGANSVP